MKVIKKNGKYAVLNKIGVEVKTFESGHKARLFVAGKLERK